MSKTYDIAIAGATGAVGEALLQILEQRKFPVGTLFPLASERSIGRTVKFCGEDLQVQLLNDFDFKQVQLGLFSAGAAVSAEIVTSAGVVTAVAANAAGTAISNTAAIVTSTAKNRTLFDAKVDIPKSLRISSDSDRPS